MKSRLLTIIAVGLVSFTLIPLLQFYGGNQIMMNGFSVSGNTVWLITIIFSMISWFLFVCASKNIPIHRIPLSVISGTFLIIPFHDVLGPTASVIVGLIAGFVAFIFHKYMDDRDKKYLMIAVVTVIVYYLALTMIVILVPNTPHMWDTGDGIDTWSGTVDGIERQVHLEWRIVETIWIIVLVIPGVIIDYKFYKRIKIKY